MSKIILQLVVISLLAFYLQHLSIYMYLFQKAPVITSEELWHGYSLHIYVMCTITK